MQHSLQRLAIVDVITASTGLVDSEVGFPASEGCGGSVDAWPQSLYLM